MVFSLGRCTLDELAEVIVLVMPGVQGLAAHLELNIGVCIIIGGISSI